MPHRTPALKRLRDHVARENLTHRALAQLLTEESSLFGGRVSDKQVQHIMCGRRQPTLLQACAIQRVFRDIEHELWLTT